MPRKKQPIPAEDLGLIRFASCRLHKAAVEAISRSKEMTLPDTLQPLWRTLKIDSSQSPKGGWLEGDIGLASPDEALYEVLNRRGALAMQAHYALWGIYYRDNLGEPYLTVKVADLCDDLGYARLPGGRGHRAENKREAIQIVKALSQIYIAADYHLPSGKKRRISSRLWADGALVHEAQATMPQTYEPLAFSFAPGAWFFNDDWRRFNAYTGVAASGFLGLDAGNKEKWAVLVGGYLMAVAPMNNFQDRVGKSALATRTLCEKVGLWTAYYDRPTEMMRKLERALNTLAVADILAAWNFAGSVQDKVEITWIQTVKSFGAR